MTRSNQLLKTRELNNMSIKGAGLGFRRDMLSDLQSLPPNSVDFFEIAPENWLRSGKLFEAQLTEFTEQYPFVCHGLSLSIGSADALDINLLHDIKRFMRRHNIQLYTEHLSWCSYNGHLYDLLPIPFTFESAQWVANRVKRVQDILEMPIALENASYYFRPPNSDMNETDFIQTVLTEANCNLHLDVNNVYVNSKNFGFDALNYLEQLPLERVNYLHVAGHFTEPDGFIIDTHGADVINPVWELLEKTYQLLGPDASQLPTCLERDFNFPCINDLLDEIQIIKNLQSNVSTLELERE